MTCSTEEDWYKLKRLTRYLFGTTKRELRIGANDMTWMNVFIDAAYGVHPDMKSHTGGCIYFWRGAIMSKSVKQVLNTTSSTESELVGNSGFISSAIYTSFFLDAQDIRCNHQQSIRIIRAL